MDRPLWKDIALVGVRLIATVLTVVLVIFAGAGALSAVWNVDPYISDGECNIAVFPLDGAILPFTGFGDFDLIVTPDLVNEFITTAEEDPDIDGILVEINSPGGTPVASEQIARRLADSTLPVVGLVGDVGASGGYMVAAATDFLIASAMSDVGGIGVNMSYLEQSEKNEEEGIEYVQLIAGKFKDLGSPDRPITEEERALLQQDLDIVHNEFIDIVTEYRELPREEVVALADGSAMPGRRAVDVGLIDAIGGRTEAGAALAGYLDVDFSDIVYCEYEAPILPI